MMLAAMPFFERLSLRSSALPRFVKLATWIQYCSVEGLGAAGAAEVEEALGLAAAVEVAAAPEVAGLVDAAGFEAVAAGAAAVAAPACPAAEALLARAAVSAAVGGARSSGLSP